MLFGLEFVVCGDRLVRRETGRKYAAKVRCSEGGAIHTGPESCASNREVRGEALTGEDAGQPLSGESAYPGCRCC